MKLKKMLAAVLTMAMVATALPVTAFAATELPAAVDGVITLTEDVNLSANVVIDSEEESMKIVVPEGLKIQFTSGEGFVVANQGSLTISGAGTISELDNDGKGNYAPIRVYGGGTVDVSGVTLEGWACIMVRQDGAKTEGKVEMSGCGNENISVTVKDATLKGVTDTADGTGIGFFVNGGVKGGEITLEDTDVEATGVGVLQAGGVETKITNCEITGVEAGVEVRDGSLEVDGKNTKIKSTANTYSLTENGSGSTTVGAGLAVVSHDGRSPEVTVNDGTITGVVGVVASASDGRNAKEPQENAEGTATVTLAGGTITATSTAGSDAYGVRVLDGSTVTLSGATVEAKVGETDTDAYGVYVRGLGADSADETKLTVSGGSVSGVTYAIAGNGNETDYDNTVIEVTGGEITSDGVAIYQPQNGTLDISGDDTVITGTTGVYALNGEVTISGGTITGTAEYADVSTTSNGATGTGAAVVIENNSTYNNTENSDNFVPSITGGTFVSEKSDKVVQSATTKGEAAAVTGFVSGGNYSDSLVGTGILDSSLTKELVLNSDSIDAPISYYTDSTEDAEEIQTVVNNAGVSGTVKDISSGEGGEGEGTTVAPEAPSTSSSKSSAKKYSASIDKDEIENGSVKLSSTRAKKGATVTITVTPDEGYELDELVVLDSDGDEVELKDKGNGKYTFVMPRGGVEIEASFEEADEAPVVDEPADEEETLILTIDQLAYLLNGEPGVNDVAPVIQGERTFLPIRLIAEFLGATVTWSEADQTVTIVKGDTEIVIYIGQAFALVNGEPVQLDAPAFIANDRTYLPLRFVAENLGADVVWNGETRTVTIIG